MEKKPFIAQSSLVPVLACIAAILFSANFYQFMKRNFKKWWGWDFRCPTEQVCYRANTFVIQRHHHFDHHRRHDFRFRHDRQQRHTIVLDFDRYRSDQAHRDLQQAEEALQRNLERAMRDLERLNKRMAWDATAATDLERLEDEVRIKAENLERLQRELKVHTSPDASDWESEDVHQLHFESEDGNVDIIIKK